MQQQQLEEEIIIEFVDDVFPLSIVIELFYRCIVLLEDFYTDNVTLLRCNH